VRRRALLAAALLAACSTGPKPDAVVDARRRDEDAVAARDPDDPRDAGKWIVVQHGEAVAAASLPDDAVRAAEQSSPDALHRFVYRPSDRGQRLYRMAYVPDGGVAAGRKFLADLGLEATSSAGRAAGLRRHGGGAGIDLTQTPRFAIEVASLDGSARVQLAAAYDPDFDGGLLVTRAAAAALHLERFELPGGADVQVALGRPFTAARATAIVTVSALQTSGPAEVVFETPAPKR
jgi:hypothetical protein